MSKVGILAATIRSERKQLWRTNGWYNDLTSSRPDFDALSLVPEKPLLLSPSLAATIGLDEALMLQALHDQISSRGRLGRDSRLWIELDSASLHALFPFWSPQDCQRVSASLRDKGILMIDSPPLTECNSLRCAIDEAPARASTPAPLPRSAPGKTLMAPNWQPDEQILRQLEMNQVPRDFALQQVAEFVSYWRERGEGAHSWGSKFRSQVLRRWREREAGFQVASDEPQPMQRHWQPSEDAVDILCKGGIPKDFLQDAIPEFVLYWLERGDAGRTWNSRFVSHVKRQWARCSQALAADGEPSRLAADWQPVGDVFDILRLANIDLAFARELLPEFVLYWRERGEVSSSWNSKFLQFVKHQWARRHRLGSTTDTQHEEGQQAAAGRSTRSRSLSEDLSDRSWAG